MGKIFHGRERERITESLCSDMYIMDYSLYLTVLRICNTDLGLDIGKWILKVEC